jgi:hypothetical protein
MFNGEGTDIFYLIYSPYIDFKGGIRIMRGEIVCQVNFPIIPNQTDIAGLAEFQQFPAGRLDIAAGGDNPGGRIGTHSPADELPGLKVRLGRDRARVYDVCVGRLRKRDYSMAFGPELFFYGCRFKLIDLTAQGLNGNPLYFRQ